MATDRRSPEETLKLNQKIDALIADGMTLTEATKKMNVAGSVYRRYMAKKNGGESGSMKASALPPRPLSNGKNKGKRGVVNLKDVASVAKRISTLDVRLGKFTELRDERKKLANHLMEMLKTP